MTGGVHGYETSGVQGALLFLQTAGAAYSAVFNLLVVPCVSPWGYETVQRWNAQAVDPNRSFNPDGEVVAGRSFNPEAATEESSALLALLATLEVEQWTCHVDLHETTDSDESEFRPAKACMCICVCRQIERERERWEEGDSRRVCVWCSTYHGAPPLTMVLHLLTMVCPRRRATATPMPRRARSPTASTSWRTRPTRRSGLGLGLGLGSGLGLGLGYPKVSTSSHADSANLQVRVRVRVIGRRLLPRWRTRPTYRRRGTRPSSRRCVR